MSYLAAIYLLGCGADYEPTPEEVEAQRKYYEEQKEREKHTIFTESQFHDLGRIEGESGALGVKVLRDKVGVLYWMDTKVWPFHYPFCVGNLGEKRTLQEFNEQVYTGKDRSMMFATVVSYPAPDNKRYYCVELNPADPMNELEALDAFFKQLKENLFPNLQSTLYFHPTSGAQIEAVNGKTLCLPIIHSSKIFGAVQYKMVQAGLIDRKTVRIFTKYPYSEAELNNWLLQRTASEVVVIPSVPTDIPAVGAVICGEIIPPLCHVALLCQNRKTPCCFVNQCIPRVKNANLADQVVKGLVAKTGYFLNGKDQLPAVRITVEKLEIQSPNTAVINLVDMHEDKQHTTDIHVVGAKAAQLARVEGIYSQSIFNGTFVVPFHHYEKHVYGNKELYSTIQQLVKDMQGNSNLNINNFSKLQTAIRAVQIDDELVKSVIEKMKQNNMTSVIFRSSTNAEDLTGFNGAGLYDSVPLKGESLNDPQQVGAALKKVWASVWNAKAVIERHHYHIEHRNVGMAVLVQPFVDAKLAGVTVHYNGVCITHDVARHKVKHGFLVNCYPGSELRATNHYKKKLPEQTMLVLGRETTSVDLQLVDMASGLYHSLVTQYDAEKMVKVFGTLHSTLLKKPHKLDDTVALDIEFMVVDRDRAQDKRELIVLQARPYNVNVAADSDNLERQLATFARGHRYYNTHKTLFEWTI